jgi:hypothetical protein
LGGIGAASEDARSALEKLGAQINAPAPVDNGITAVVRDLVAAKNRAQDVDRVIRTELPAAIAKLSGAELVKFRSEFVSAMDAAKSALKDAINTDRPRAEIDALRAKVDSFEKSTRTGLALIAEQAAQNLGVDVPLSFNKMTAEFGRANDDMALLIRSMPELKAAGVDAAAVVGQALSKLVDSAKTQAELDAVAERILALGKASQLTKPAVNELMDEAKKKAEELRVKLEELNPGFVGVSKAAKKAGIDIGEVTTGISKGFAEGVNDVDKLALAIKASGVAAAIAEPQLAKALDQRLQSAQTRQEVELVIAEYKKLGDQGLLTGDNLKEGLQKGQDKLASMTKGVNDLREAYGQLGLKTPEELKKISDANSAAWDKVKGDSAANLDTLKAAFSTYAQSAIAATGSVGSEQRRTTEAVLQQEGAVKGLTVSFDAQGKMVVQTQAEAAAAINGATGALRGQKSALDDVTSALEAQNAAIERNNAAKEKAIALENKRLNRDAQGFALDDQGNRRIESGNQVYSERAIYDMGKEKGLTEQQALQVAAIYKDTQKTNEMYTPVGERWMDKLTQAIDQMTLENARAKARADAGQGASANAGTGTAVDSQAQGSGPVRQAAPAPVAAQVASQAAVSPAYQAQQTNNSVGKSSTNLTINVTAGVSMASRGDVEKLARAIMPAINDLQRKGVRSAG